MGFFFSQQKEKTHRPFVKFAAPTPQNMQTLNRLGCKVCPLDKAKICSPKMAPTLAKKTEVYFFAEAPGQDEDENSGKPLTGPSGKLLRSCIPEDWEDLCSFDNTISCRPPKNRTPVWEEVECCRPRHVVFIEKAKPKVIVGLGAVPLKALTGAGEITSLRGRFFAIRVGNHTCWFIPTYHPSFIIRRAHNKQRPLNSQLGYCFRKDIERAFAATKLAAPVVDDAAEIRSNIKVFNGEGLEALLGLLERARKAPQKAVDIETSALRPYATNARILTAAVSFAGQNFSFAIDHPKTKWRVGERDEILTALGTLLKDDTLKIAHNSPFELEWFISYFGKDVVNPKAWGCTQMQAHILDERRGGQALDDLCRQHFGIAYKSTFKLNKKDMAASNIDEMLIYNAVDTKYTLRLFELQKHLIQQEGLTQVYDDSIQRQSAVALMQHIGISIDQSEVKRAQVRLADDLTTLRQQIASLQAVKKFEATYHAFNPLSGPDVLSIFKDVLRIDLKAIAFREDEGGTRLSLDRGVLEKIDHPLASLIVRYRNRNKMKSTYVDCFEAGKGAFLWPDGKVHTSFNTTFTETARTSSSGPNNQNWPKRNDAWVRRQVKAGKGEIILSLDYGQLQACTAAMCSKDKVFVKALWEDYDTHMEWAIKLDKIDSALTKQHECDMSDPKLAKKYRSLIKNKLVFPAIFGATPAAIAGYLSAKQSSIDELMEEFWATFAGLKRWQDKLMEGYWENGYVEGLLGRKHRYPLTRNQAINYPVQEAEALIVCNSMCRLSYNAIQNKTWYLHPVLNIHDDLSFLIPDDDRVVEETVEYLYKIMLSPPYDFINVPLSVEASLGYNWEPYDKVSNPYGMQDVGKFWSHKDL